MVSLPHIKQKLLGLSVEHHILLQKQIIGKEIALKNSYPKISSLISWVLSGGVKTYRQAPHSLI